MIYLGIIGVITVILASIGLQADTTETDTKETDNPETKIEKSEITSEIDVIMPNKVSRPGCEKTDSCYIPSVITIKQGEQVVWLNEDVAFHSVTSGLYGNQTDLFDSGHLDPEEQYAVTFDEKGDFDYFCTLHPWMAGRVLVE